MKTIKNTLFAVLFILVSTISLAQTKIPLVVTPSVTNPTCQNLDGQIELTITGGYPPYMVNGLQINTSIFVATGLGAGAYSFTVTDSYYSYIGVLDILLVSPSSVQVSSIVNNVTTLGGSNGSIQLDVVSTTPVTYFWETTSTTPLVNNTIEDQINIAEGIYKVLITDSYGCEYTKRFIVDEVISMPNFNPNITISVPNQPSAINVYPNPSNGNVTIKFDKDVQEIKVLTSTGNVVRTSNSTTILNDLEHGDYFIHYTNNGETKVSRFVVL